MAVAVRLSLWASWVFCLLIGGIACFPAPKGDSSGYPNLNTARDSYDGSQGRISGPSGLAPIASINSRSSFQKGRKGLYQNRYTPGDVQPVRSLAPVQQSVQMVPHSSQGSASGLSGLVPVASTNSRSSFQGVRKVFSRTRYTPGEVRMAARVTPVQQQVHSSQDSSDLSGLVPIASTNSHSSFQQGRKGLYQNRYTPGGLQKMGSVPVQQQVQMVPHSSQGSVSDLSGLTPIASTNSHSSFQQGRKGLYQNRYTPGDVQKVSSAAVQQQVQVVPLSSQGSIGDLSGLVPIASTNSRSSFQQGSKGLYQNRYTPGEVQPQSGSHVAEGGSYPGVYEPSVHAFSTWVKDAERSKY